MSLHISNFEIDGRITTISMGYDRPLDYVFCTVIDDNHDVLYSNLSDENAGTDQQHVDYFREPLKALGITVPESMFIEVAKDQLRRVGNRVMRHQDETCAPD